MNLLYKHNQRSQQDGSVLLLVIMITSLLAAISASFTHSIDSQISIQRDESQALRAEFAAESGWEFSRRQLLLDSNWIGTNGPVTLLDGMTRFDIYSSIDDSDNVEGRSVHDINVNGMFGGGVSKLSGSIRINEGYFNTAELGLVFLGEDIKILSSSIQCNMLVTDIAANVSDWNSSDSGSGFYSAGGADTDGFTELNNSTVSGNLFKYNASALYQDLGQEVAITQKVQAPAWDFIGLTTPSIGKTVINYTSKITNLITEDTVVIVANSGDIIKISNCDFGGGLIVICPEGENLRESSRNQLEFKGTCTVGGGSNGLENNIGIIAPGCELLAKFGGLSVNGFSIFNQALNIKNCNFIGQTVIVKDCKKIHSTDFYHDKQVANNLPSFISFSALGSYAEDQAIHESY